MQIFTQCQDNFFGYRVTYFVFCFLPPENSVFYDRGNDEIDLFQSLEDSISDFKSNGTVIVTGD
jgi:hypothetical protein